MSAGVGVFCPKCRPKGVDLTQGTGVTFEVELAADREEGFAAEKILIKLIRLAPDECGRGLTHETDRRRLHSHWP